MVNELVREIYADGYFEGTVDGHVKNIVLKLEEGSVYVSDEFLQDVADGVRETVQECGVGVKAMTVSEGDLDDAGRIGQNKAKELVLAQLGLESSSFRDHEYELDDGVYEFEFTAGGVEYEYEVDARTGKVLEADIDGNDDWDDRDKANDDWYDHDDLDDRDDDDADDFDDVDDDHGDDDSDADDFDDDNQDDCSNCFSGYFDLYKCSIAEKHPPSFALVGALLHIRICWPTVFELVPYHC